jgi:hypothetical protein
MNCFRYCTLAYQQEKITPIHTFIYGALSVSVVQFVLSLSTCLCRGCVTTVKKSKTYITVVDLFTCITGLLINICIFRSYQYPTENSFANYEEHYNCSNCDIYCSVYFSLLYSVEELISAFLLGFVVTLITKLIIDRMFYDTDDCGEEKVGCIEYIIICYFRAIKTFVYSMIVICSPMLLLGVLNMCETITGWNVGYIQLAHTEMYCAAR